MSTISVMTGRDALEEPLPDLDISTIRTKSDALHRIDFVGKLEPWPNFKAEVANTIFSQIWSPRVTQTKLTGPNAAYSGAVEHVSVSSESEVQGRLLKRLGQYLGAVFKEQQHDLKLGGFKGTELPYDGYPKIPDFALYTQSGIAKVVGEAKVPWISKHSIKVALRALRFGHDKPFRHLLGQIANYMLDLNLKYGFLTTYEQTIFLRKVDAGRQWVLQYSPVISHKTRGSLIGGEVSLSQSLYHVALQGQQDPDFGATTGTRNQDWTK